MEPAISVIIPVYNGEAYLTECLGNVVHQTLPSIEILLVDDASTDGSLSIMEECRRQFPETVKVIALTKNQGAGGARNAAIDVARGTYIGFVDCDDLVDVTMYEKLYQKACAEDDDIVDCGYYKQADDIAMLHTSDELTGELDAAKRRELIVSGGYIVSKLFHRRLFCNPRLRFRTHAILEDSDFLNVAYVEAKKIGNVKEVLYYYREQPHSSSRVVDAGRYVHHILEAMWANYDKLHDLPSYAEIRDAVEYEILQMYSYGVNISLKAGNQTYLEELAAMKKKTVSGDDKNPYVEAKIPAMDRELMRRNDVNPEQLLADLPTLFR
jgi:glycosyltransferase involved in cell wall biosynthesis